MTWTEAVGIAGANPSEPHLCVGVAGEQAVRGGDFVPVYLVSTGLYVNDDELALILRSKAVIRNMSGVVGGRLRRFVVAMPSCCFDRIRADGIIHRDQREAILQRLADEQSVKGSRWRGRNLSS